MARLLETYRGVAYPWLIDSMGHMNTQFYCSLFDGASLHLLSRIAPFRDLLARSLGWATVRQAMDYKSEVLAGAILVVRTELLDIGTSSITFRHDLRDCETDTLYATSLHVVVLFDLSERRAEPLKPDLRSRCRELIEGSADAVSTG